MLNGIFAWGHNLTTSTRMLWGKVYYSVFFLLWKIAHAWHQSAEVRKMGVLGRPNTPTRPKPPLPKAQNRMTVPTERPCTPQRTLQHLQEANSLKRNPSSLPKGPTLTAQPALWRAPLTPTMHRELAHFLSDSAKTPICLTTLAKRNHVQKEKNYRKWLLAQQA